MSDAARSIWTLPVALALLAGIFALLVDRANPPVPLGADAPPELFSAERARTELSRLLGDERPHPVGTAANRAVKERLEARLTELGLPYEEQHTIGCSTRWAACASVENVIATLAGKESDALALMAHYDSVQNAPGAGDDGAGVAAVLEAARILSASAPHRNTLLFVFTDAEEAGLLGAEGFFKEHPAAKRIRAVLNLEGSGSSGPVYLLRSSPGSGNLLAAFRAVAPQPAAQSFAEELFKHMPNDTDFSVSMRAGIPGIDFAFAGERNHYHTPLDTIANLDLGTLQHHGENVVPLAKVLAEADLSITAPNEVYANIGKRSWLHWSPDTGVVLAGAAAFLLLLATWRLPVSVPRVLAGAGIALGALMLVVVIELAACWLTDRIAPARAPWPADPWPWRAILYATPVLVLALSGPFAARRIGSWPMLLGAWWVWTIGAVAMAMLLPLAAYLFVAPVVVAGALATIFSFSPRLSSDVGADVVAVVSLAVAGWFFLALAYTGESTQGYLLAPAIFAPLAVLTAIALPAAPTDRHRQIALIAALALIAGVVLTGVIAPYSPIRPQHLDLMYLRDVDARTAKFVAWSENPLPQRMRAVAPFAARKDAVPWSTDEMQTTSASTLLDHAATVAAEPIQDAAWRRYRVTPAPGANAVSVWLPVAAIADVVRVEGREVTLRARDAGATYREMRFSAPPSDGFTLDIQPKESGAIDAYLVDIEWRLPGEADKLVAARGDLAVPVHSGDWSGVYRKVTL